MENVRIAWLDVVKGILILFVLLSYSSASIVYIRFFAPHFSNDVFLFRGNNIFRQRLIPYFYHWQNKTFVCSSYFYGLIKLVMVCLLQGDNFLERSERSFVVGLRKE